MSFVSTHAPFLADHLNKNTTEIASELYAGVDFGQLNWFEQQWGESCLIYRLDHSMKLILCAC